MAAFLHQQRDKCTLDEWRSTASNFLLTGARSPIYL